jgi:poly(hydroxyalkanoate) granule-associated protein
MDSAHRIWLAGMGAFSMAQDEGSKLFDSLVEEGEKLEKRTRQAAEDTAQGVRGKIEDVKGKASQSMGRLEQVFEERVARALNRLGVPTADDVAAMTRRVEELNAHLQELKAEKVKKASAAKA